MAAVEERAQATRYESYPGALALDDETCRHCGQREAQHWSDGLCFTDEELADRLSRHDLAPRPDAAQRERERHAMAVDLMTEEGRAEAERLARQLVDGGATLTVGDGELGSLNDLVDDEDDEGDDEDERPFEEVYDEAVRAVLANRSRFDTLAAHAKSAKEDLKASIERLQNLRKVGARTDEPRQLPLRRG